MGFGCHGNGNDSDGRPVLLSAGGRREGAAGAAALKLKEDVEFLKANLTALWDIVASLQARAAEERQDESDELVLNLGLKKNQTWSPAFKNSFDSQVRRRRRLGLEDPPRLTRSFFPLVLPFVRFE